MKKATFILFVMAVTAIAAAAFAGEGWEASITVSVQNAENRLSFGQRADATDGIDGYYDVPALLGGDIKAYFELGDDMYWRDVRSDGSKSWSMAVESELLNRTISIGWDCGEMPVNAKVLLMDDKKKTAIDMKMSNGYSYNNNGLRHFRIVVEK